MIKYLANGKKVPVIPLILVNNKLLTNFNDKTIFFNDFFGKQCQCITKQQHPPISSNFCF